MIWPIKRFEIINSCLFIRYQYKNLRSPCCREVELMNWSYLGEQCEDDILLSLLDFNTKLLYVTNQSIPLLCTVMTLSISGPL